MLPTLLILTSMVAEAKPLAAGEQTLEVIVNGTTRRAIVHVPPGNNCRRPRAVVICFHGGGSNPRQQMVYSGLNAKADAAGFLAVYPEGSGRLPGVLTWNAGNCCGYAQRQDIDDVAFVAALLDELVRRTEIDEQRIYATGISNGAMMSYRLASELSDRIAAIAPIAGTMGTESCHPQRPVPVIHFHGTGDEFVNFDGGPGVRSTTRTKFFSVAHTMRTWAAANGCELQPHIEPLPDTSEDGMTVERHAYGPGAGGSEVILYKIIGGGHTWPGRTSRAQFLGPSTRDISANDLMWEFFEKHPLP